MSGRGFLPPATDDERLLVKRAQELADRARYTGRTGTTLFCNEREQALAVYAMSRADWTNYCFFGGYEEAQRAILCVYDGSFDPACVPITAVRAKVSGAGKALTHRDYLGALMALGIKRECIGDILCDDAGTVLFVVNSVLPLVLDELRAAGRATLTCTVDCAQNLPEQTASEPRTVTLASLRVDALLAAMLRISRSDAAALIRKKDLQINHVETETVHAAVYEGDVFTVRGKGKFKLCEIGNRSKKDRIFVSYIQY